MKRSFWWAVRIAILLLTLITVGIYAVFRHHSLQAEQHPKTYTATYNYPLTFTGVQQAEYTQRLLFQPSYGNIHDWYIQHGKKIKKDTPILEYYNSKAEQKLTALRKQITALRQKNKTTKLQNFLEEQFYLAQTSLRIKEFSLIEGTLQILEPFPSHDKQVFAKIYSTQRVIKAIIDEKYYHQLKTNQEVNIKAHDKKSFKGKIIKLDHYPNDFGERASKYTVFISTENTIPIGTHFDISLPTHLISLPKEVLYDKNSVIIKKDEKFVKRIIKYHEKSGMVIISEGLLPGEKVIAQSKNFTFN